MAISAYTVLEVRTGGSDNNGGGFVTGSAGTDYSQQNTAQYAFTDLVITATTTIVSSASHSFVTADIGNLIQITAGTGFTLGFYQVMTVSGGNATLDRSAGTASSTNGSWALGGALGSWAKAATTATVQGMMVWIQSGTYNVTSNTVNASNGPVQTQASYIHWEGYQTTRGDKLGAPILFNTGTATNKILFDNSGYSNSEIINLMIDGNHITGSQGFYTGPFNFCYLLTVQNCPNYGYEVAQQTVMVGCLAQSNQIGFDTNGPPIFIGCICKANTANGFNLGQGGTCIACISYGQTGGDGFSLFTRSQIHNCVSYGNSRYGINLSSGQYSITNCIIEGNPSGGVNNNGNRVWMMNNAFYNNTAGAILVANPAVNINQINNTSSAFTNASGGDFSLNSTVGGGSGLKGTGYPGKFPLGLSTGHIDIGAVQTAAGVSGGGATSYLFSGV